MKFPKLKTIYFLNEEKESPRDVFGLSLDDPGKYPDQQQTPPENNSQKEHQFLDGLGTWFGTSVPGEEGGDSPWARMVVSEIIPAIKQGKYPELKPPGAFVYRGMGLRAANFQNLVRGIKIEYDSSFQEKVGYGKKGTLPAFRGETAPSSWSLSKNTAVDFARLSGDKSIAVVFIADTRNPKNNFILNPKRITDTYPLKQGGPLNSQMITAEQEIIGFGPIEFGEFIFVEKVDGYIRILKSALADY
jgi:hypothetical protein